MGIFSRHYNRRDDASCKIFHLKNLHRREVIYQDLFTSAELELLMERENGIPTLKQKNQVIVSLLIY